MSTYRGARGNRTCPLTKDPAYRSQRALTITLKPHNYVFTPKSQYMYFRNEIQTILAECGIQSYYMVPELTKAGNVHFHGWYFATGKENKEVSRLFARCIGFLISKKCDKLWISYMTKKFTETKKNLSDCLKHVDDLRFDEDSAKCDYPLEVIPPPPKLERTKVNKLIEKWVDSDGDTVHSGSPPDFIENIDTQPAEETNHDSFETI